MTETRAAYEAATLEAMHTGDYTALTAYARTVADADEEPPVAPPPHVDGDDYTWAGPSYPAAPVLAEDNAALREQITQLHCDYSGQIATLELRVAELEDIINRKWGNPFMHMRDSAVFAALDALAAYWHIITLPLDSGGVLMRLYDPATMEKAVEFTGPLHDVVLHAAAWFDGVKFEVQP